MPSVKLRPRLPSEGGPEAFTRRSHRPPLLRNSGRDWERLAKSFLRRAGQLVDSRPIFPVLKPPYIGSNFREVPSYSCSTSTPTDSGLVVKPQLVLISTRSFSLHPDHHPGSRIGNRAGNAGSLCTSVLRLSPVHFTDRLQRGYPDYLPVDGPVTARGLRIG